MVDCRTEATRVELDKYSVARNKESKLWHDRFNRWENSSHSCPETLINAIIRSPNITLIALIRLYSNQGKIFKWFTNILMRMLRDSYKARPKTHETYGFPCF